MAPDKIKDGVVVSIAYRLTADGEEVEIVPKEDPIEYLHGAENIVPGLEKALAGKAAGEKVSITLKPEDAYGEYDAEDVETVDREDLPDELEAGMEVLLEDNAGNFFEATIKEVSDESVTLDFNMPLAGKTITYDVEILELRDADEEELAHGHPHSYEDEFDDDDWDDEDWDDEDDE